MGSDIMPRMAKEVIHISEAEAANNFADVLARVRAGAEIVIDGQEPVVVVTVRALKPQPGRLLSESIALAEANGSTVTLDGDFARDLEDIINSHREPLNPPEWD
jgi:antitoxin (DNA-binding transcriptional repressor) of toxin-antitoxin stability system